MLDFLRRRWFLTALGLGVLIAAVHPQWLAWTGYIDPRYVVVPSLFLMSWSLPTDRVLQALRNPLPALWAALLSFTLVPALALALGLLSPVPDFRIGLLVMAASPLTLASVLIWTRMAGGDDATALLALTLTNASSFLVTTAWLTWGTGEAISVPYAQMMLDLVLNTLLPICLGQAARAIGPMAQFATARRKALGAAAQTLILLIIWQAAWKIGVRLYGSASGIGPGDFLASIALPMAVHLTALCAGLWSSRALGMSRPNQAAVAFASSQKTLPIALYLFTEYFQASYPLAIMPIAFYHFGQLIVDTFIAEKLAGNDRKSAGPAPPVGLANNPEPTPRQAARSDQGQTP